MNAILVLKNGEEIKKELKQATPVISFFKSKKDLDLYSLPTYIEFVFKTYDPIKKTFVYKEK